MSAASEGRAQLVAVLAAILQAGDRAGHSVREVQRDTDHIYVPDHIYYVNIAEDLLALCEFSVEDEPASEERVAAAGEGRDDAHA
jgi:hypothetical protein